MVERGSAMTNIEERAHEGRRGGQPMTRRAVLCWASGAAALAGTATAGAEAARGTTDAALADLASAASRVAGATKGPVPVGPLGAFPPASRIAFDAPRICVVRDVNGVAAISTTCPHLGCIVGPAEAGFTCACHGSRFDRHGAVVGGPAPASLAWYAVRLAPNGDLEVDTSVKVEPGTYLAV